MPKKDREPPAPTPLDAVLSEERLESSPWIQLRIKALRLEGKKVKGWTPPVFGTAWIEADSSLTQRIR